MSQHIERQMDKLSIKETLSPIIDIFNTHLNVDHNFTQLFIRLYNQQLNITKDMEEKENQPIQLWTKFGHSVMNDAFNELVALNVATVGLSCVSELAQIYAIKEKFTHILIQNITDVGSVPTNEELNLLERMTIRCLHSVFGLKSDGFGDQQNQHFSAVMGAIAQALMAVGSTKEILKRRRI